MAHTDDIAEKLTDLLVDQTARAATTGLDAGYNLAKGAGTLTQKAIAKLMANIEDRKELARLLGIEGEISTAQMSEVIKRLGEESSTVRVANSDCKEYEALLQKNGLMYAKMNDSNDNAKLFVFLNRDREKIENVATILRANRGRITEVRPDLYINQLAPEHVRVVDGLDHAEMELFRHYARQEALLYTSLQRGSKYAVVFDSEQEPKARAALLHTGWDLTGVNGARVREQVEYRLKGRTAINIALDEGKPELYILNKHNPKEFIHITADDFSTHKNDKQISQVPRGQHDFYNRCMNAIEGMDAAVILTGEQYHSDLTAQDLQDRRTIDLFARYHEEMAEMAQQNSLIHLVSQKSSLDEDYNATWGLWDSSVSYSEFAHYEDIMDDEEREAREREFEHFKQAAFYAQNNFAMQNIHLDERNVDFIIMKAEEKRKAQTAPERKREARKEPEPEKASDPFDL